MTEVSGLLSSLWDSWERWRSPVRKKSVTETGGQEKESDSQAQSACCSRSPEGMTGTHHFVNNQHGMLVVHEVVCPGSTESGLGACRMGYHAGRRRRSPWKREQPEAGHEWCRITLSTEAAAQKLSWLEGVMLQRDKMSLGDCGAAVWCLKFDGCPDPDLPWQVR